MKLDFEFWKEGRHFRRIDQVSERTVDETGLHDL